MYAYRPSVSHFVTFVLQCRDTFWVESFNHQLLTYAPKRIHFSTSTFLMRLNLAVMDWVGVVHVHVSIYRHVHTVWVLTVHPCIVLYNVHVHSVYTYSSAYCILYTQNENVNRAHTSACKVRDLRRPDRRTAMKALVQKTFKFVDVLWEMYISRNRESLK